MIDVLVTVKLIKVRVSWSGTETIVLEAEKQLSDASLYRDVNN